MLLFLSVFEILPDKKTFWADDTLGYPNSSNTETPVNDLLSEHLDNKTVTVSQQNCTIRITKPKCTVFGIPHQNLFLCCGLFMHSSEIIYLIDPIDKTVFLYVIYLLKCVGLKRATVFKLKNC